MKKNHKICFLNSVKSWGGGEKWHFDMAKKLNENGYDVIFFCHKKSVLEKKLEETQIPKHSISIGNLSFLNIFKLLFLASLFKKEKIDCLIMNGSSDIKTAGLAAKITNVKRIIYRRGSAIPIRNTFFNRFLFKKVITDVIANSEATKRTINQNNPNMFAPGKIEVIYNGIEINKLPSMHEKHRSDEKEIIIGNAARLAPQKGHDLLIEIAKELKTKTSNFKILLAGDGPLRENIERLIEENNLKQNIILLGFQKNIFDFMDSIDIFILTSRWEGFGFVLAEAMLRKKPIVAWNLSSNPELVKPGKNGYLAKPFDIKEFADYVQTLIDTPEERKMFGETGYKFTLENFDMNNSLNKLCHFLHI
ncbi:glycosyltransferase [Marinilabilia rubra]|uniref:Glycosyltransferase family 1 protein n=1 Tax=Marinilabilia rubra TaxID=2162893 RepID=A0A2U2B8N4_9BACT|nr:glycosyltransferase [Marinilabilia rubra]PWD99425.1 glycosyltransferase family 1 protein [Marinilabilia rubra]